MARRKRKLGRLPKAQKPRSGETWEQMMNRVAPGYDWSEKGMIEASMKDKTRNRPVDTLPGSVEIFLIVAGVVVVGGVAVAGAGLALFILNRVRR